MIWKNWLRDKILLKSLNWKPTKVQIPLLIFIKSNLFSNINMSWLEISIFYENKILQR